MDMMASSEFQHVRSMKRCSDPLEPTYLGIQSVSRSLSHSRSVTVSPRERGNSNGQVEGGGAHEG